jgi:hypothetical protein
VRADEPRCESAGVGPRAIPPNRGHAPQPGAVDADEAGAAAAQFPLIASSNQTTRATFSL